MSIQIDSTTGRVLTSKKNVVIPSENAGVGDVVFLDSNRNMRIIACGTYDSSTIAATIGSGYVPYGIIFSFCNGMAYLLAATAAVSRKFTEGVSETTTSSNYPNCAADLTESRMSTGKMEMRNGLTTSYQAGMNLSRIMARAWTGDNTIVHPTSAATDVSTKMSKANFDALVAGNGNAKDIYGTYENYLRQIMSVPTAGSLFTCHDSGHKPHEQGKWNTYLIGRYSDTNPDTNVSARGGTADWSAGVYYPAAQYCFNYYVEGSGETATDHNWWLPTMGELQELLRDENYERVNACGVVTFNITSYNYWCCIPRNEYTVWFYQYVGGCTYYAYVNQYYRVRPVTLLKLT